MSGMLYAVAPRLLGAVIGMIGLYLTIGGLQLALLGGSLYYAPTGIALLASAVFLCLLRRMGIWIYLAMLGWTLLWALWEVGLDGWGLAARLLAPAVLALPFLLPAVRRRLA